RRNTGSARNDFLRVPNPSRGEHPATGCEQLPSLAGVANYPLGISSLMRRLDSHTATITLQVFFCIFLKNGNSLRYYECMPKLLKPVIIIVLAVGVATGAAVFLSRGTEKPAETVSTPSHVDIKGGGNIRGPENAQLTLVEFGDYECPSCGGWHPFVKEILNRYPDKLRLEFHHYPLISVHPNAMAGAMAVEAAGEQGRYWDMHDALFEHQGEWGESRNPEPIFINLATRIGLDV